VFSTYIRDFYFPVCYFRVFYLRALYYVHFTFACFPSPRLLIQLSKRHKSSLHIIVNIVNIYLYILADLASIVSPYKFNKKCIKRNEYIIEHMYLCGRLDTSATLVDIKERHVNGVYQQ